MTRTRRAAMVGLASLVLVGCDLDFVAVGELLEVTATVRSLHGDSLTADLLLGLPPDATPVTVAFDGRSVPGVASPGGGTIYRASVVPDSLHPSVRLFIENESGRIFDGSIPLLARHGPAESTPTGLLLPLAHGPSAEEPDDEAWAVSFSDSAGTELLLLASTAVPLPSPLRIDRDIIPEAAVQAEVVRLARFFFSAGPSTVRLVAVSRVLFPLP